MGWDIVSCSPEKVCMCSFEIYWKPNKQIASCLSGMMRYIFVSFLKKVAAGCTCALLLEASLSVISFNQHCLCSQEIYCDVWIFCAQMV